MRVAFIGLGLMGSRMAQNLVRKGFAVTVHNRTRARAESLLAKGAAWAATPREAAAAADVVCTCLGDPASVEAMTLGSDGLVAGLQKGALWLEFTTLSPALSLGEARLAAERGARFVEAPVTGSKAGAEAGTLVVMCGAAAADLAAAMPVLQAVSAKQLHVGAVGEAAQVKLIGNMLIAHMMEGLAEGAALAAAAKIPLEKVLEVVRASGFASPYWDFKGKAIQARDFSTHFSIDLMHKDLTLAMATGQALGVPMPGTSAIREVYQLARAAGLGAEDIVATAKVTQPALGK